MAEQQITRRIRSQKRESSILTSARGLVREHGFLGMRITAVAKASGVSVGTLYTHFESREDLILALASRSLRGRLDGFEHVFADDSLGPAERLVVAVCLDFLFSVDHPELFAAEQLSATPSVWDGGSARRALEVSSHHAEIMLHISAAARAAIDRDEFDPWTDRGAQAAAIDRGIWTLMAGSSHVRATVARVHGDYESQTERVLPGSLQANIAALFSGYGWRSTQPKADVERLAEYATRLPTITTNSDGDDAPRTN